MSRRLISYPTGWTLAVLDDARSAAAAAAELEEEGVARDELVVLDGSDAASGLVRLGSSSGLAGRLRRGLQFMTMDQLPDLHVYELAIERGHPVVGIRLAEAPRRKAIETLRRHGAHFINRFGAWATEEIAAWRGTMPDLPQHMRR